MKDSEIIEVNGRIPVEWDRRSSLCKGCGLRIGWGITLQEKRMPFNFDDNHTAHWATCSSANEMRKKTKK